MEAAGGFAILGVPDIDSDAVLSLGWCEVMLGMPSRVRQGQNLEKADGPFPWDNLDSSGGTWRCAR